MKLITARNKNTADVIFPYWKLGLRFTFGITPFKSNTNSNTVMIPGTPQPMKT